MPCLRWEKLTLKLFTSVNKQSSQELHSPCKYILLGKWLFLAFFGNGLWQMIYIPLTCCQPQKKGSLFFCLSGSFCKAHFILSIEQP